MSDALHNEDVAHEHSDINVRAIVLSLVGLTLVCVAAGAAMWGVFVVLDSQAAKNDPTLSPLATPATEMPTTTRSPYFGNAPDPKLITSEPAVLADQHKQDEQVLQSGDWVDRNAGIGRIPIDEAKKLLLHKGLPARAGQPVDPRLGTHAPSMSDASSGRNAAVKPATPQGPAKPR